MEIAVDLAGGTVVLRDGANFRAFQVAATGAGGDDELGDLLELHGAGRRGRDPNHVWISKSWLVAQADTAAAASGASLDGVLARLARAEKCLLASQAAVLAG